MNIDYLESLFNDFGLVDYTFIFISIGGFWSIFYDIICSFCAYIQEKAWRVSDYEKIIYKLNELNNLNFLNLDFEEKEVYYNAIDSYNKRLRKLKNMEKLKNKIANLFKKKK